MIFLVFLRNWLPILLFFLRDCRIFKGIFSASLRRRRRVREPSVSSDLLDLAALDLVAVLAPRSVLAALVRLQGQPTASHAWGSDWLTAGVEDRRRPSN